MQQVAAHYPRMPVDVLRHCGQRHSSAAKEGKLSQAQCFHIAAAAARHYCTDYDAQLAARPDAKGEARDSVHQQVVGLLQSWGGPAKLRQCE